MDPRWDSKRRQMFRDTVDNPASSSLNNNHRNLKTKILSPHEGDAWEEICYLKKTRMKIERKAADLKFLKQCRDNNLIPLFTQIKPKPHLNRYNKYFSKLSFNLIHGEIKKNRALLDKIGRAHV